MKQGRASSEDVWASSQIEEGRMLRGELNTLYYEFVIGTGFHRDIHGLRYHEFGDRLGDLRFPI
jgi:hypothetical protein